MASIEPYPMPSFPMLTVADVAASKRWYETLGFVTVFTMPGPDGIALAHLRWLRYADLLLRMGGPADGPKGLGVTFNFMVTSDIDALAERARAAGATFLVEIGDRPWNARDFTLSDPDGFALTFTFGPLRKQASFADAIGQNSGDDG